MLKDLRDIVKIGNWPVIFIFAFLRRGVTTTVLNIEGNVPSENERLAKVAIKSAKTA